VSVPGKSFFYTAPGIDLGGGAEPDDCVLLSSGRMVADHSRAKGIQAGQFTIPFAFPTGRAADDVVVTDDANSKARLPAVTCGPSPPPGFEFKRCRRFYWRPRRLRRCR
jgi:hypothetical protein